MCTSASCARRSTIQVSRPSSPPSAAWATCSMQFRALRRTTTFRLTLLYGLVFTVGVVALLGLIYLQSAVYLTRRMDGILNTEADALVHSPRSGLRRRITEE